MTHLAFTFHRTAPSPVRKPSPKTFGLGDAAAQVAQPIAKAIDALAKTKIAKCRDCTGPGGRKDKLNALVPDITFGILKRTTKADHE